MTARRPVDPATACHPGGGDITRPARLKRLGIRAMFEAKRLVDRIAGRGPAAPGAPAHFGRYTEFWEAMARQYKAEGQVYRTIGSATEADFVASSQVLYWGCVHNGLRPHHRVLDIGCGSGRLAIALQDYLRPPGSYLGVDVSATLIEEARRAVVRPNFRFAVNEALPLPLPDRSLDFVVLFSVFTHLYLEDIVSFLREIRRLLAPDGRCLATVLVDAGIAEAAGTIGEMRHNPDFIRRVVAREGLRVASVQQHWGLPFVHQPDVMTQDAREITRDEGGRQTCLLIVPA